MARARRLDAARTLLSRAGWATVLVLAGSGLLVSPPTTGGAPLLAAVVGVLAVAFAIVLVGTRLVATVRS